MPRNYSCMEVCGMPKHCGNKYCSNHPNYVPPASKKAKKKQEDSAPSTPTRQRGSFFKSLRGAFSGKNTDSARR